MKHGLKAIGGSEHAKKVDLFNHFESEAGTAGRLHFHKVKSKLNASEILNQAPTPVNVFEDLRQRFMG